MGTKEGAAKARATRQQQAQQPAGGAPSKPADTSKDMSTDTTTRSIEKALDSETARVVFELPEPIDLDLVDLQLIEPVKIGAAHQQYLNPDLERFRRANLKMRLRGELVWIEWEEQRDHNKVRVRIIVTLANIRWMTPAEGPRKRSG